MLRSAVINNLVPEDKRDIIFSTQIPDEEDESEGINCDSKYLKLEERVEKLETIVKKLVEYLVKESDNHTNEP